MEPTNTPPRRARARGVRRQRAAVQLVRSRARRLPAERRSCRSACAGTATVLADAHRAAGARDDRRRAARRGRALLAGRRAVADRRARRSATRSCIDHLDGRVHARRGVDDDRRAHPAVRRAPGAMVPPRPAHTLGRHRARPGRRGAAGRARRSTDCTTHEHARRSPSTTASATTSSSCSTRTVDDLAGARPAGVRPAPRHRRRRPARRRVGRRLRRADGAVQRRRQPRRDERQRHPLLRPGAGRRAAATSTPQRILTDAGERLVDAVADRRPDTIEASVDMGAVEPIDEPRGWDELGCHPDRPVVHLSVGNPHSVVGVDDVDAVDLLALGARCRTSTSRSSSPAPSRTRSRCASTSAAPASPRRAARAPCAARGPPLQWGLVRRASTEIVVHMDGGSATVTARPTGAGHGHADRPGDLHRHDRRSTHRRRSRRTSR